jgi:hypothetical protein
MLFRVYANSCKTFSYFFCVVSDFNRGPLKFRGPFLIRYVPDITGKNYVNNYKYFITLTGWCDPNFAGQNQ